MSESNGATGAASLRGTIDDLLSEPLPASPGPTPGPALPVPGPSDMATTAGTSMPEFMAIRPMDYGAEKSKAEKSARKAMHGLLKFYLSQDIIDGHEYVQAKAKLATMQLGVMISQMKASEHAIMSLLKTIHTGDFHPRMFEVLAGMQKTLLDIMKMQTVHMMATEEGFKKLRADLGQTATLPKDSPAGIGPQRGTRGMMMELQAELNKSELEEGFDDEESDGEEESRG